MREEWDIPRVIAWNKYLDDHPTVQAMVQAYLKIKPKVRHVQGQGTDSMASALIADLMKLEGAAQRPRAPRPVIKEFVSGKQI